MPSDLVQIKESFLAWNCQTSVLNSYNDHYSIFLSERFNSLRVQAGSRRHLWTYSYRLRQRCQLIHNDVNLLAQCEYNCVF